jgi:hypothetical protein
MRRRLASLFAQATHLLAHQEFVKTNARDGKSFLVLCWFLSGNLLSCFPTFRTD